MRLGIVKQRMQQAVLRRRSSRIRKEIALELIASVAGVHEIVVALVTLFRDGTKMVNRQFAAAAFFSHAAIAAAIVIVPPYLFVFGVGH